MAPAKVRGLTEARDPRAQEAVADLQMMIQKGERPVDSEGCEPE